MKLCTDYEICIIMCKINIYQNTLASKILSLSNKASLNAAALFQF